MTKARKGPRPMPAGMAATEVIRFRVRPKDKREIEKAARRASVSVSEFLRMLALDEIRAIETFDRMR